MLLKWAIPAYTLLLILAVIIKRRAVRQRIGKEPVLLSQKSPPVEGYLKKRFHLFFGLWLGGLNLAAFYPPFVEKTPHLDFPEAVLGGGLVFLFASWGLFALSLKHLKEAWRIGIDHEKTDQLITTGIYGKIRHPIYSAIKLALIGTLLIFPNLYFLPVVLMGWMGVSLTALLEEDFLTQKFGEAYLQYCGRTGHFLPRIKKPRPPEADGV